MNFARGSFRVWVVLSLFWAGFIVFMSWEDIRNDRAWISDAWWENDALVSLPVKCEDARGAKGTDYFVKDAPEPWNRYRNLNAACWYDAGRFRELWPEYSDLEHNLLESKLYASLGWTMDEDRDPLLFTKKAGLVALLPPMVLLIAGLLVAWAFAGFRKAA